MDAVSGMRGAALGQIPNAFNQAPKPPTPFDTVSSALDEAHQLISRVEALADKLVGPSPCAANGLDSPSPSGHLHDMADRADRLRSRILADGHAALERIEAALP
jgi:hypothetical protein